MSDPLAGIPEELRVLFEKPRPKVADPNVPPTTFPAAFEQWHLTTQPTPGRVPSIISTDLRRHFMEFCAQRGWSIEVPPDRTWGAALGSLGLRGVERRQKDRREFRLLLMTAEAATFFKAWLEENPTPPLGSIPSNLSNWQRSSKELREQEKSDSGD